jgi:hypothetical protein
MNLNMRFLKTSKIKANPNKSAVFFLEQCKNSETKVRFTCSSGI